MHTAVALIVHNESYWFKELGLTFFTQRYPASMILCWERMCPIY